MTLPTNHAAFLKGTNEPLVVQEAPYPAAGENQIVVRAHAVAINPVDYALQMLGEGLFPWIRYPLILGEDVAGEVVAVGAGVTRFSPGDRVVGHGVGSDANEPAESAFQHYPVLRSNMVAAIPEWMPYESAAVIPLGLSTAISGLFQPDYLGLQYPSMAPKPTGKTLLIWGGATSVGSNAIQLAVAAGYDVLTTCSPKNFGYVERLGASQAFDYKRPSIREDLLAAFRGRTCAGALAIAGVDPLTRTEATDACIDIVARSEGDKFVALSMPAPENIPAGVQAKFIFASNVKDHEVSSAIYNDYLPQALANRSFVPAPEPEVVGSGLEAIQGALDVLKRGVSAKKIVVSLP